MRETFIKVRPFEFIDILSYEGFQGINEHGTVKISGHIHAGDEEAYIQMLKQDVWADVFMTDESGNETVLFNGIVAEALIQVRNHVKILSLELKTGTWLMDQDLHIRTYQDSGLMYKEILQSCLQRYPGGAMISTAGKGEQTGRFICQYQETDWEFFRRMANRIHTVLVANHTVQGTKLFLGFPQRSGQTELLSNDYEVIRTNGTMCWKTEVRDVYKLGDIVLFLGNKLRIVQIHTRMEGSELYHTCYLMAEKDIIAGAEYNPHVIGVSLDATVLSVSRDTVCISVTDDENKGKPGVCKFPYATVYSSSDGTGWYCMPEPGDSVRLYFPDEAEEHAYVISSSHLESSDGEERCNPDYKSIMNAQGKEVLFRPDALIMTNNAGMSIELSDREGIRISSNLPVIIRSEQAIDLSSVSSSVEIHAPDSIVLEQNGTQMSLAGNVMMKGARVRLN